MSLFLSQRDPRWKSLKLGKSDLEMEQNGSATVSLTEGLRSLGCDIYPDAIAKKKENYTKGGLIIWNNLKLPGNFKFKWRYYGRNDKAITASIKSPNEFVILQVADGTHWVLGMNKHVFSNNYNVGDPWKARKEVCIPTFKNITGSAHFYRP